MSPSYELHDLFDFCSRGLHAAGGNQSQAQAHGGRDRGLHAAGGSRSSGAGACSKIGGFHVAGGNSISRSPSSPSSPWFPRHRAIPTSARTASGARAWSPRCWGNPEFVALTLHGHPWTLGTAQHSAAQRGTARHSATNSRNYPRSSEIVALSRSQRNNLSKSPLVSGNCCTDSDSAQHFPEVPLYLGKLLRWECRDVKGDMREQGRRWGTGSAMGSGTGDGERGR